MFIVLNSQNQVVLAGLYGKPKIARMQVNDRYVTSQTQKKILNQRACGKSDVKEYAYLCVDINKRITIKSIPFLSNSLLGLNRLELASVRIRFEVGAESMKMEA
jgi:hypothetical protein